MPAPPDSEAFAEEIKKAVHAFLAEQATVSNETLDDVADLAKAVAVTFREYGFLDELDMAVSYEVVHEPIGAGAIIEVTRPDVVEAWTAGMMKVPGPMDATDRG